MSAFYRLSAASSDAAEAVLAPLAQHWPNRRLCGERGAGHQGVKRRADLGSVALHDLGNEDDDLFGRTVVTARRLCDAADGGQVVVSDVVWLLVRGVWRSSSSHSAPWT